MNSMTYDLSRVVDATKRPLQLTLFSNYALRIMVTFLPPFKSKYGGIQMYANWYIGDGSTLQFEVYGRNVGWNDVPGLYIFSCQTVNGWCPLYVGQAKSFKERLPNHERMDEVRRLGALHIHAMVVKEKLRRDKWERMLIQNLNPPLNVQHRGLLVNNLLSH